MPQVLWARSHVRWTERQWKRVLWSDESTFQLGFWKNGCLRAKDEKDHPDCYQQKVQKPALWWYGGASVPTAWVICYMWRYQMQRLMLQFWRDICCRQDEDFSQELHAYFSRTMPGLILHELQHVACIECVCLTGLPAVQICPIENVWRIIKRRIRQLRPRTVEQLKSCIHQEWEKFHLQNCNITIWLQSIIKRKGDVSQW